MIRRSRSSDLPPGESLLAAAVSTPGAAVGSSTGAAGAGSQDLVGGALGAAIAIAMDLVMERASKNEGDDELNVGLDPPPYVMIGVTDQRVLFWKLTREFRVKVEDLYGTFSRDSLVAVELREVPKGRRVRFTFTDGLQLGFKIAKLDVAPVQAVVAAVDAA